MTNSKQTGKTLAPSPSRMRCGIYTRKSTEEGLDQEFNSLDAQRDAAAAFILSQRREGWIALLVVDRFVPCGHLWAGPRSS